MDHFSGARYPAVTMRRFYPAMYGKNLTFQPSQYGGPTSGAPATSGTGGASSVWSKVGGFFADPEVAGGIGTLAGGVTQHFLQQSAMDRETKRRAMSSESEARLAESQARISALQASQRGGESNALLWVGGGIFLLALVGGGIYFATRK
jgi:hypothetical protein